jgi:hypothetical protein
MTFRKPIIRLASLTVLLASGLDYWAYDRWDPAAPMNSSGPEALAVFVSQDASNVSVHCARVPDDHCLWCSPTMAPAAPQLALGCFGSSVVYPTGPSAWNSSRPAIFFPRRDPAEFDGPLRV